MYFSPSPYRIRKTQHHITVGGMPSSPAQTKVDRTGYVVSQDLVKVSSLLPSNKNRSFLVHSLTRSLGLLSTSSSPSPVETSTSEGCQDERTRILQIIRPRLATVQELCLDHDRDYVDFVLQDGRGDRKGAASCQRENEKSLADASSEFGIEDDCPPFFGMGKYVQMIAGATLSAAESLKSGETDIAIAWDGGRHHAQKGRAAGFCYVADCILAILSFKRAPPLSAHPGRRKARVMHLDFDLHFSDAVSECFHKSSSGTALAQVLTLSIHYTAPGFYPPNPLASLPDESTDFDPFTLSLPLKQGASAKTFGRVWPIVENVKDTFSPDYVVVQCGTDGLAGDPHGIWNWNTGSEKGTLDWCISEIVNKWNAKILLLGGGGYNSPNTARAWASLTSVVLGRHIPPDTPIPDHSAFPLYAPSFTLDVPAGNMRDENSEEYLCKVEAVYSTVIARLRERFKMAFAELVQIIPKPWLHVVVAFGLVTLAKFALKTAGVLLQTFIVPGKSLKKYMSRSESGSWAVITGATDGIGKEFAVQLAKKGFNILLVSRSQDKLNVAASEIEALSKAKTKTLVIDFLAPTEEDYSALSATCSGLDIGILVNNVGRSHEFPVSFAETRLEEMQSIININTHATLRVTQIVLRNMLQQRRGLILTLTSFAGAIPSPLLATYSASKAFLQTWCDALQSELKGTGVDVECVSTYFVVSNMSRIRRPTALIPMPNPYVSSVLKKIGLPCGALWTGRPSTSTPYWSHALLDYFINVIDSKPGFIAYTLNLHKDIRRRALRKKEREAAAAAAASKRDY
ncbi:hypothetical protein ACEPAF_5466 [Sanghuangporus sanghuang]